METINYNPIIDNTLADGIIKNRYKCKLFAITNYSSHFNAKWGLFDAYEVIAVKDESELNFDSKYGRNGNYLKIAETIE